MVKIILILTAAACLVALAWLSGFNPVMRKKRKREPVEDDRKEDTSYRIDELIVGKKYGDCLPATAADTPENGESFEENKATFASQDVRGDEPEGSESDEKTAGSHPAVTAPDGTDHSEHVPQFNYELILVDGDPELGDDARDETRRVLPSRPVIPPKDTGKILDDLIYDDQPGFETDANESERKVMESFDMEDFR